MAIKRLYEFTIPFETQVDKTDTSINEKGETVSVTRKVTDTTQRKFFIRRPNQAMHNEADLFYGEKFAEAIRRGLLPRAVLERKLKEDGGALSKDDLERHDILTKTVLALQEQYQKLLLVKEEDRNDDQKQEIDKLRGEFANTAKELNRIEASRYSLFENTAEAYANNKLSVWWGMFLSYEDKDSKEEPFFGNGKYEDRLAKYDDFSERNEKFESFAVERFMLFVGFWGLNRAREVTRDEFIEIEKRFRETDVDKKA